MPFEVDVLPTNTRVPGNKFGYDTRNALQGLNVSEKNVLLAVQKTADGNAELLKRYSVGSEEAAIKLFGRGSTGHIAVRNAIATFSSGSYFAVAIENKGESAQGAIEISGTAKEGGVLKFTVGQESVSVTVRANDTAQTLLANTLSALSSDNLALQVIPSIEETKETSIILSAKCAGASGNTIGISVSIENADGISVDVLEMGNGADDISVPEIFSKLAESKNNIISFPYDWKTEEGSGDYANLQKYLDKVAGPQEMNSTIAVIGAIGDFSTEQPKLPNNPRIAFVNIRNTYCSLDSIVASVAAQILSEPDPAIGFNNDVLPTLAPDSNGTDYLDGEKEILLRAGITPLQITASGNVSIVRLISTHTVGVSEKIPDMWVRTLDYTREAIRADLETATRKAKDTQRTAKMVRAVILGTLLKLETAEILKNVRQWSDRLTVERNPDNIGFFLARIPADAVIPLHGVHGMIDLIIS